MSAKTQLVDANTSLEIKYYHFGILSLSPKKYPQAISPFSIFSGSCLHSIELARKGPLTNLNLVGRVSTGSTSPLKTNTSRAKSHGRSHGGNQSVCRKSHSKVESYNLYVRPSHWASSAICRQLKTPTLMNCFSYYLRSSWKFATEGHVPFTLPVRCPRNHTLVISMNCKQRMELWVETIKSGLEVLPHGAYNNAVSIDQWIIVALKGVHSFGQTCDNKITKRGVSPTWLCDRLVNWGVESLVDGDVNQIIGPTALRKYLEEQSPPIILKIF